MKSFICSLPIVFTSYVASLLLLAFGAAAQDVNDFLQALSPGSRTVVTGPGDNDPFAAIGATNRVVLFNGDDRAERNSAAMQAAVSDAFRSSEISHGMAPSTPPVTTIDIRPGAYDFMRH